MNKTALQTVLSYNMLNKDDRVIAAVSGGADSMALLCFLLEIQKEFNLSIYVCHINHLLRGGDAEDDQKFVEDFCTSRAIPFFLERCDVKALAQKKSIGFEECGRQVRYAFFEKVARQIGGNVKIATAHTLNDCAETLVFNLARGSSPAGLCSIAPVRDNIIRPLLRCERSQIEQYLKSQNQGWRDDKSNCDTSYSRNFIRHKMIPLFKTLNPAFETAVLNLTELSREQQAFFEQSVNSAYNEVYSEGSLDFNELSKANIAVKRGIIAKFLRDNNVVVTKKLTEQILSLCQNGFFSISVGKEMNICLKDGKIFYTNPLKPRPAQNIEQPVVLEKTVIAGQSKLVLEEITQEQFEKIKFFSPKLLKNCLNYDIIDDSFVIRTRKSGDFISLFPRNVTKTLKKLFNEYKIEAQKRDIIPVLASGSHVFWIDSVGVDRECAVTQSTKRILFIEASDIK